MRTTIHVFGSKRSGCSKAFTYSYLGDVSIRYYWFGRKIILLGVCHLGVVKGFCKRTEEEGQEGLLK
jgi:hypothetical protein